MENIKYKCLWCDKEVSRISNLRQHSFMMHNKSIYTLSKSQKILEEKKYNNNETELLIAALCYVPKHSKNKELKKYALNIVKKNFKVTEDKINKEDNIICLKDTENKGWMEYCEECENKIKMLKNSFDKIIGVKCKILLNNSFYQGNIYNEEERPFKCDKIKQVKNNNKIKYISVIGKTIADIKLRNINKDGKSFIPFFELMFTDGSNFIMKSNSIGEYEAEHSEVV